MIRPLKTREFLAEVTEIARMQLPSHLRDLHLIGPMASLVKLHYGDPKVHYEVWVRRRIGTVEVGLHFEGPAERNVYYLKQLTEHHGHVIASLGPEVETEQWTESWTRVHQVFPFVKLDEDLLIVVLGRLSHMVRLLEPCVREISGA